jgi:uncharacterized membrane protein YdjX (TVP38/TMEM64 family)
MKRKLKNNKVLLYITFILVCFAVAMLLFLVFKGKHYFTHRGIREVEQYISSFGIWSPAIVFFLILLSTAIPPLPLPLPLLEIASGLMYTFWPAFILVWISQILSSLLAFGMSRYIGKRLLTSLLKNKYFLLYEHYVISKGPIAVLITRATMASPFNIVSFLSGLTHMRLAYFTLATIVGTIPESALYAYIGSIIRHSRFSLWHLFILVVLLGMIGPFVTLIAVKILNNNEKRARAKLRKE